MQPAETWFDHMRRGEFEAAWRITDHDVRRGRAADWYLQPRHFQRIWTGAPLANRIVLIRCYHGLGDTLQFIRYAPLVKRVAREVIVWAQPELIPLLERLPGVDRLLPLHEGDVGVHYDVDVEVMELPHIFRTTTATIPPPPVIELSSASLKRRGNLAAGIVWRAGDWDDRRSLNSEHILPLLQLPDIDWHILQRGAALSELPANLGIRSGSDDVLATARVMRALDLIITVDSFPAHLAGTLRVPTWTLLHRDADWRWIRNRDTSPWYPTMRLIWQRSAGGWENVVTRLDQALRARISARKASP